MEYRRCHGGSTHGRPLAGAGEISLLTERRLALGCCFHRPIMNRSVNGRERRTAREIKETGEHLKRRPCHESESGTS